jgi:hypothetical protein
VIASLLIGEFPLVHSVEGTLAESLRQIGSNAFSKRHARTRDVRVSPHLRLTFSAERGRQTENDLLIEIHLYTNDALLGG